MEEAKLRALTARWMEEGRVVEEAVEAFAQVAEHEESRLSGVVPREWE